MRIGRWAAGLAAAVLVAGGVSACGGGGATEQTGASGEGFPVRIRSALGTATVEKAPKRVVTIGWGSQDVALALGVVPVGIQDFTADSGTGNGVLPWDRPKLGNAKPTLIKATTSEVPYEKIAALRPDVILAANSGITAAQYGKLKQLAPTVAYPGKPWETSLADQTRLVGKALGKPKQAEALLKRERARIAAVAREHPEFKGKTVAFGSGTEPGSMNFYYDQDSRVQLLTDLGFTPAPSVSKLGSGGSQNAFAKTVSLESLPDIDSDVLVSWYLAPSVRRSLEGNALFRKMPAVRNGAYVPLTDPALVYATSAPSVLSVPWMLDRYAPELSKAAKKAG